MKRRITDEEIQEICDEIENEIVWPSVPYCNIDAEVFPRKPQYPTMLRDECLVRLVKPERMNATKILWIPDSAQRDDSELYQGVVLACGPGRRRKDGRINPNEIQPGDRVLFHWSAFKADVANVQWHEDGEELRIVSEWQVQARWPGELTLMEAMRGE